MKNRSSEFRTGSLMVQAGASGFLDRVCLGDCPVLDATDKHDFRGAWLDVFVPDEPDERFPVHGQVIPVAPVARDVEVSDGRIDVKTSASATNVSGEFYASITRDGDRLTADLLLDLSGTGWIASAGFVLPLAVDADPLQRRTTVGGETRNEIWRLDQNDEDTSEEWQRKVSDKKARWPLWRIGGLLVDAPHHYTIWKSSDLTTPPLPMDQGICCPGWIAYQAPPGMVRVQWEQMQRAAPAGFTIDSVSGLLWIWLHPPSVRPMRVVPYFRREARITIDFQVDQTAGYVEKTQSTQGKHDGHP